MAKSGSGFTLLFESFAMLLIENEIPVNKVAKILQVYPARLWNVLDYWISIAHQEDTIETISKVPKTWARTTIIRTFQRFLGYKKQARGRKLFSLLV